MRLSNLFLLCIGVASAQQTVIRFTCSELPFTLHSGETPEKRLPETTAGGVGLFDADGDGDLDMYFANGAEVPSLRKTSQQHWNRLYLNDGSGRFSDHTAESQTSGTGFDIAVAAADYDNDGDQDLFVGGVWRDTLFRNRGNGVFDDVTREAGLDAAGRPWTVGALWLDYDNDGLLDIFAVRYVQWDPETEQRCPVNALNDYCHPKLYEPAPNALYRNNGDGTFADVSAKSGIVAFPGKGMAAAAADYDLDGDLDIFVTNDREMNFLFVNEAGRFQERGLDAGVALPHDGAAVSGMGTDFRDLNDDGRPDILFTALANETFPVFFNTGGGFDDAGFRTRLSILSRKKAGWSIAAADFDFDGRKDIFAACSDVLSPQGTRGESAKQTNALYRQQDSGQFEDLSDPAGLAARTARMYRGAAVGDVNGDGLIDVVVTALNAPAELCLNRTAAPGNSISIQLEGRDTNRDGIGAKVVVQTGVAAHYDHLSRQSGYASSSEGVLRFGLGTLKKAERIEIQWPSGKRQVIEGVAAGASLRIRESGTTGGEP